MIRIFLAIVVIIILGAVAALAEDFKHAEHLTYVPETPCSTCHVEGAKSIVPDNKVCLECHDQDEIDQVKLLGLKTHGPIWALNHRSFAKNKASDCASCHQQSYCLECHKAGFADEQGDFGNNMINVHRSDFHVTHPISARTDPQLCSSCHETKFCKDCHDRFAPEDLAILSHRRGWSDLQISPSGPAHSQFDESQCLSCHPGSVLLAHDWSSSHAREARKNLATCQACHLEGDICLKCHSSKTGLRVNPHPKSWGNIKGRLDRASKGSVCRKCH